MNPSPKRPARLSGPSTTLPSQYAEVQIGRLFSRAGLGNIVKFSKLKCLPSVAHVGFMHQQTKHVKSFIIQRHPGYIPHLRHFQVAQISPQTRPEYQPAIGHGVQGQRSFRQLDGRPGRENHDPGPQPNTGCPGSRPREKYQRVQVRRGQKVWDPEGVVAPGLRFLGQGRRVNNS